MAQKQEESTEITYVLIETSFDQGAPAPIFLIIEHVRYDVIVTVVPEYSGWISGNWSYSPGEDVFLEATPSWGYSFVQWETQDGNVLSTEPYYSFKMPENDVELVARFQESINVYFMVTGNMYGKLHAYLNESPLSYGQAVPEGSSVMLEAQPFPGYMVEYWTVNYEILNGNTSNILVLDNLQSSVVVMVSFAEIPANHHLLTFNVLGSGGSLTASSGASQLFSGIALLNGSSVTFTAVHYQNMRVKRWKHNGAVVAGNVSNTYVISSLNAGAHVTVEFETITSIDEPMEANLVVYPNPFTDQLFFSTDKEISRILVVNVMGQTVLEFNNPSEKILDLQIINEGFYLVVFETTDSKRIVHRVVKSGR
jgi:hypothetical protein